MRNKVLLSLVTITTTAMALLTPISDAAPLQKMEANQLVTLEKMRQVMQGSPDRFAGLSTRGSGDVTIHLLDKDRSAGRDLDAVMTAGSTDGMRIAVDYRKHSLAELTRIQDAIPASKPFGALGDELVRWGVDNDTNSVQVGVTRPTAELRAAAHEAFGDAVTVVPAEPLTLLPPRQVDPVSTLGTGRRTDTTPFNGGDMIDVRPPGGGYCTSGFTLTNLFGTRYAITASHCGPLNQRYETNNRTNFGTVLFSHPSVDAELVGGVSYRGVIWVGGTDTAATRAPVHSTRDSCRGCAVYFDGAFTGQALSTLVGDPFCGSVAGRNVCDLQLTSSAAACQPGDSGGPVFAFDGLGGVIAVGIITAKDQFGRCVYTRIAPILAQWTATITTG